MILNPILILKSFFELVLINCHTEIATFIIVSQYICFFLNCDLEQILKLLTEIGSVGPKRRCNIAETCTDQNEKLLRKPIVSSVLISNTIKTHGKTVDAILVIN